MTGEGREVKNLELRLMSFMDGPLLRIYILSSFVRTIILYTVNIQFKKFTFIVLKVNAGKMEFYTQWFDRSSHFNDTL